MIEVMRAIIVSQDRLLAGKRPEGMSLAGLWELPGGKLEPEETPADCLMRECFEEFAITVSVADPMPAVERVHKGRLYRMSTYLCTYHGGKVQALEHEEARWQPIDRLFELEWAPADLQILQNWVRASVARPVLHS